MCARNNSNNNINWGGGHITRPDLNKNASRYEGQVWYDPTSLKPYKWMKDDVDNWYVVPSEDYDNCRAGVVGSYNAPCAVAIGYGSTACGTYSSAVGSYDSEGAGYDVMTGVTYQGNYGGNFSNRSIPDVHYNEDTNTYLRHLYRQELELKGLMGIGINDFGLPPSEQRDDKELCKKIVDKFKTNEMATRFEKRLADALNRKKEIEERKNALLKRMKQDQLVAVQNRNQKIEELKKKVRDKSTGFQGFIDDLDDAKYQGNINTADFFKSIKDIGKEPSSTPYRPQQGLSDTLDNMMKANKPTLTPEEEEKIKNDDLVKYFIATNLDWSNFYQHYGEEVDGLRYVEFEFVPSIDEDDEKLDLLVALKGRVVDSEEKSANELVRGVQDDREVSNTIGNFLGKFTKKKTYIKRIRVKYDNILEKAKESK